MRDIVSNIGLVTAIAPAVYTADNTPPALDLLGFGSAMLSIHVGVGGITFTGTNKIEFVLTHSEDGTTFDPVTDDDVQGVAGTTGGIVLALKAAHADPSVTKVGYVGNRRYLKLLADFSGTHGTGTPIAATLVKGNPSQAPVT
ncbi:MULTISPECIES: hypothetical protein [unclassified Shinella]|uniref:hypothetical protein n=1 Tax=unclassified Shinella TaxID=2643062 RepID=UPI00225C5359|nr:MULTISPECIES: hypothetical protein [unclassified Shinella]MCO5139288.1 hypothetical protein [Shinella sp.]MDC7255983.1 hypothetical protein [Shinella sp. YE25]CAI0338819.1 conserved hypothetical protein [Rhizobiaceae bacterium]CAK7257250.1 conserved protein of unknown function [Shinella sp. WSC3-e]